jgi:aryl-phospho-beta-D-glucosidase BglC (GH1 family)
MKGVYTYMRNIFTMKAFFITCIFTIFILFTGLNNNSVWAAGTVKVNKVTLKASQVAIEVGKTSTITVTVSPSNASNKKVSFLSSNNAVAKISSDGQITALKIGICVVTVKANDGSGKSANLTVIIYNPMTSWEKEELNKAITLGIIPKSIQNNYYKAVTEKELYQLLSNCINKQTGKTNIAWANKVKTASASKILKRQDIAEIIYNAATQGLGIKKSNGEPFNNGSGMCFMDEKQAGNNFTAMKFLNGQFDLTSNARVMETTDDFYFRINDYMTRIEAIQAAYRLYNSVIANPEYISFNDVGTLNLTDDQIKASKKLPEASVQKLPNWSGLTLANKLFDDVPAQIGSLMYVEQDVKNISDLGFNFVRAPLNYYAICLSEQNPKVNMVQIKNIDNLIEWGIKYRVHICLDVHSLPGFASTYTRSTNYNEDFYENEKRQELACGFWSMLARRYANVPNSVLSFDLLNEPMSYPSEEACNNVIKKIINAIRIEDSSRLIFIDGLQAADGSPAQSPDEGLKGNNVSQSMHYYNPSFFTYNAFNNCGYPPQGWPLPYVNGWTWGTKQNGVPLTIKGDFEKGLKINVTVSALGDFGDIVVKADGKEILRKTIDKHTVGVNGCTSILDNSDSPDIESANYDLDLTAELQQPVQKIEIFYENGWWMKLSNIVLIYPENINTATPYFNSVMSGSGIKYYTKNKIINILCSDGEPDTPASTDVIVDKNGIYSNQAQDDLYFDINAMRKFVSKWADFAKKNNVAIMCQEFGVWNTVPHDASLSWLNDWLTVLKENNIPWCMWGYSEQLGIFNSDRYDVKYEKYGPYLLDREMLQLLQKYQYK